MWKTIQDILSLIGTAIIAFLTGKKEAQKDERIEELEAALKGAKRVQEVPVNTELESALDRLRKSGKLRD